MKELEVTLRVRNNLIKARRVALGLTLAGLSQAVGVNVVTLSGLECLKIDPFGSRGWTKSAQKLASFFGVTEETLFPAHVTAIKTPCAVAEIEVHDLTHVLSTHQQKMLMPPDEILEKEEKLIHLESLLSYLDARSRRIIEGRADGKSLNDIAIEEGISTERVRSIEQEALRHMRMASSRGERAVKYVREKYAAKEARRLERERKHP
jgi:RNA polymerase sigma factor (sigma-70 family)